MPDASGAVAPALPRDTNILIVAPNASTKYGGEAILPVHYFRVLSERGLPVTLLAHARNRPSLAEAFGADMPGIEFIEDTIWHKILWNMGRPFPAKIRQFSFAALMNLINERYQARRIRALVAEGRADIIHQPTPVSPKTPSSIHGFGVPVVIGPMNGGMDLPEGYEDFARASERSFERFARGLSRLANRLLPGKARAATLVVANERTREALAVDHPRVIVLPENGVNLSTFPAGRKTPPSPAGRLRLMFLGRLVDWKAVDISLEAIAKARTDGLDVTLDILGDGAERRRLETRARELGLEEAVSFHGFQDQARCAEFLQEADALLLNSVFECGGAVVLEAMSVGLPVIAPDWGGPADYVTPETGILVHPIPRADFAARLAAAMAKLAADPQARVAMGEAGAARVRAEFDWDRKVDRMLEIYAEALAR